ncbi:hypothetical protein ONS96_013951 [Cadophora gregata f. sp. sojae]|nr:hypothetical protein ONS96_013951 [Cadophora gregata f. sp. sojae]
MINEHFEPGQHWNPQNDINPLWILGIYLPGMYESGNLDDFDKTFTVIQPHTAEIIKKARETLKPMVGAAISAYTASSKDSDDNGTKNAIEMLLPVKTPDTITMMLLQILRQERAVTDLETSLRLSLNSTTQMPDTPACNELLEMLQSKTAPTLLEKFTTQGIKLLRKWQSSDLIVTSLPKLPAAVINSMAIFEGGDDDGNLATEPATESDGNGDELDAVDLGVRLGGTGQPPLQRLLSQSLLDNLPEVEFYDCFVGPTTGALLCYSLSELGSEGWHPSSQSISKDILKSNSNSLSAVAQRAQSHMDGRILSDKEHQSMKSADNVLDASLRNLENTMNARTGEAKEKFEKICARMCATIARPAGMDDLDAKALFFGQVSQPLQEDNWYHVRRLLQLMEKIAKLEAAIAERFHMDLMLILAAIEGGTSDPIPWFIALDGVLKSLWAAVKNSTNSTSGSVLRLVMEELTVFSHGTAVLAVARRFEIHSLDVKDAITAKASNVTSWYSTLFRYDPRCANSQCLRLLPAPAIAKTAAIRQAFSVGTQEARIGHPAIRAFISRNRLHGFPCLLFFILFRRPHGTLVGVFYWLSHMFHVQGCKSSRGKWWANFA